MKKLIVVFLLAAFVNTTMANERNEEICRPLGWEIMSLAELNKCKKDLVKI